LTIQVPKASTTSSDRIMKYVTKQMKNFCVYRISTRKPVTPAPRKPSITQSIVPKIDDMICEKVPVPPLDAVRLFVNDDTISSMTVMNEAIAGMPESNEIRH